MPQNNFFEFPIISIGQEDQNILQIGNNKKGVLVVSKDKVQGDIYELLTKILAAIHLSIEEDILLLHHISNLRLRNYLIDPKFHSVITFGVTPKQMGLQITGTKYQVSTLYDNRILMADSLTEIATDQKKKKMLWNSLKTLLNA